MTEEYGNPLAPIEGIRPNTCDGCRAQEPDGGLKPAGELLLCGKCLQRSLEVLEDDGEGR